VIAAVAKDVWVLVEVFHAYEKAASFSMSLRPVMVGWRTRISESPTARLSGKE
jgi:hypothetical protein